MRYSIQVFLRKMGETMRMKTYGEDSSSSRDTIDPKIPNIDSDCTDNIIPPSKPINKAKKP